MPDDRIFETIAFNKDTIKEHLEEVAFLNKGLEINFIIEADKGEEVTDFYIYHRDYGVKMLMFGLCNYDASEQEEILYANAPRYMDIYKDEYMD